MGMFELGESMGGVSQARIKVIGVGGAGGNVVNNMISSNIRNVEFVAVNTDAQSLENSMAQLRIQIGKNVTRGLGAGSKPEIGREAAMEDKEQITDLLEGTDMVFITAGMGGGTGTGAAPIVAEIARDMGILTVGVVTKPFTYEGGRRKANAEMGVKALRDNVDTMIVIPNDRIAMVVEKGTPLLECFAIANDVLRHAVQGISDLVLVPGLINLDFADVKTIIKDAGRAVIGMGIAQGPNAAAEAAAKAIHNPLLENTSVDGCQGILINITGGLTVSLDDIQSAATPIHEVAMQDANIIMGAVIDPDLKDQIKVTVIATRFSAEHEERRPAMPKVQDVAPVRRPVEPQPVREVAPAMVAAEPVRARAEAAQPASAPSMAPRQHVAKPAPQPVAAAPAQAPRPMPQASPAQKAPAQHAPVQHAPVQHAPAQHAPAQQQVSRPAPQRPAAAARPAAPQQPVRQQQRKPAPPALRGSERVLAKSLLAETAKIAEAARQASVNKDVLDVPTFLRRPVQPSFKEM